MAKPSPNSGHGRRTDSTISLVPLTPDPALETKLRVKPADLMWAEGVEMAAKKPSGKKRGTR